MTPTTDIVVVSPTGRTLLAVECKASRSSSKEDAARFRRNLLVNGLIPDATFLLLALSTDLYLWNSATAADSLPEFTANAKEDFRRYLGKIADQPGGPRAESLRLAIASWLDSLAGMLRQPDMDSAPDRMLVDSGLYEQMKNATIKTESDA